MTYFETDSECRLLLPDEPPDQQLFAFDFVLSRRVYDFVRVTMNKLSRQLWTEDVVLALGDAYREGYVAQTCHAETQSQS